MVISQALTHGLILSILHCAGAIQFQTLPGHVNTAFATQGDQESAERSVPNLLPAITPNLPTLQGSAPNLLPAITPNLPTLPSSAPNLLPAVTPILPTLQGSANGTYTYAGDQAAAAAQEYPDLTAAVSQSGTFEQLLSSILRLGANMQTKSLASSQFPLGQAQVQSLADVPKPVGDLADAKVPKKMHLPTSKMQLVDPLVKGFFKGYVSPFVEDCFNGHEDIPALVEAIYAKGSALKAVKASQHLENPHGKYLKECVPVVAAAKAEVAALGHFNPVLNYYGHWPVAASEMMQYVTNLMFGNRETAGLHLGYLMRLGVFGSTTQ